MKKGENIRQRKDGRYEARYFDEKEQKMKSIYGKNYSEAKRKRQEQMAQITKTKSKKDATTIKDICLSWLEKNQIYLKQSTYANYYDKVHKHIIPNTPKGLGNIKVDKLDQAMIDSFIAHKLTKGRLDNKGGLSVKTIKDIVIVLKQISEDNNLHFTYKLPQIVLPDIKTLNNYEFNRFFHHLLYAPDSVKVSFLLSLFCGVRIGELCGIRMQDIDFENKIIHINRTVQRIKNTNSKIDTKTVVIVDIPKSNRTRDIPIPEFLLNLIKDYYKDNPNLYFSTGTTNPTEPRNLQKKFKIMLNDCCIADYNFHAIRHTFTTKAVRENFDLKSLSEILGHSDVKFTMSRYVHSSPEIKQNEIERYSSLFIS